MKVVAVVCVRNEEEVIGKMLLSLVTQTMVPEKIVIVNDGSTDDTGLKLSMWEDVYHKRIVVINRDDRVGGENLAGTPEMAEAFNIAFEYVEKQEYEYDYLMVCGADDEYPATYIEDLIGCMKQDDLIVVASGRKSKWKTSPSGSGRLITRKWWLEYGQRYAYPSYYWESKCIMVAAMKGYKTVLFHDIEFNTRSQGSVYGHYRYGVNHRSINYRLLTVLKYISVLVLSFQWRGCVQYIIGYCKRPKRIISEDRQFSKEYLKWRRKRKK